MNTIDSSQTVKMLMQNPAFLQEFICAPGALTFHESERLIKLDFEFNEATCASGY